jgi:CD109 antigen
VYIDTEVLNDARTWILSHQNSDGSFDSVGFVHHQEMLGGLKGKTALTAFVAIALLESGDTSASAKAIEYLETKIDETDDPYTVALLTYALELAESSRSVDAYNKLMKLANRDDNGLYWGSDQIIQAAPDLPQPGLKMMPLTPAAQTSAIETTGYATLALAQHGDALDASQAAQWLVSKRNAYGGYGSTQDTIVALQALTGQVSAARSDVNLTVSIESGGNTKELKITPENFDVLQIVDVPVDENISINVNGKGEAIGQLVRRFNVPQVEQSPDSPLKISVSYDSNQVAVNDQVTVSVDVSFNPPVYMEAGMTVLDISVPTGFAAVKESIDRMLTSQQKMKRYDIAGRKVIFYIENMISGDEVSFDFQVQALYPVRAKGVVSQAYSYYQPEISAEYLGQDITVLENK